MASFGVEVYLPFKVALYTPEDYGISASVPLSYINGAEVRI